VDITSDVLSLFAREKFNVFLLCSGDDNDDEAAAYDTHMDDDDDDVDADDCSDVKTTDDVDGRRRDASLTSSPSRRADFSSSPPSPQHSYIAAERAASSPCSWTSTPQPCRAVASATQPPCPTSASLVGVAPSPH